MTATYTTVRIDRLPKWAQRHIKELEHKVDDQERRLENRLTDFEDARIFIDAWEEHPTPIGGQYTTVRFVLDPDVYNGYVDVSFDNQRQMVRVSVNSQMIAMPVAANVILVKGEER